MNAKIELKGREIQIAFEKIPHIKTSAANKIRQRITEELKNAPSYFELGLSSESAMGDNGIVLQIGVTEEVVKNDLSWTTDEQAVIMAKKFKTRIKRWIEIINEELQIST